ncbi:hypothetical protein [Actibacterium sp. XHP0104]|uniref:hypothetical protein n=1 Tax=Actibacterium sp. XHP0104 TaxID=2984335 RepID=UPI0021E94114|nr:hypothetical protein [Actibacterium sp. XHP0104]MCV2882168.1 hypothetical protein [Actibacterium sp. XHP0104]
MLTTRWIAVLAAYGALMALGIGASQVLYTFAAPNLTEGEVLGLNAMVVTVVAIYVLASAIPFVPGAEIGLGMLMVFGAPVAVLVYLCMVAALCLAFLAGRLVPQAALVRFFEFLHLRRAAALARQSADMPPDQRLNLLIERAPTRLIPFLLRHRYLALALAFNLPGNSLLGGGGGLAMFAGLSRLFAIRWFLLSVVLAVAPVPALIMLIGYHP